MESLSDVPRLAGSAHLETTDVGPEEWLATGRQLFQEGWRFEGLWGQSNPSKRVVAAWGRRGGVKLVRLPVEDGRFPSLTPVLPASDWFERALRDRSGWTPQGHIDARPFLFHETYPPAYVDGGPLPAGPLERRWEYPFVQHEGPGVFEIPVGPIHAGIIEPGHFRFTTIGEIILDLEPRLNYTHKGTLTLARGKPVEHALRLMERLSGDNAAAHACAFGAACEAALGESVPDGVQRVRSLLVELERVYNHFGDLAGIAVDVAFAAGASHFQALREEMMRWNARLFRHRLLMNVVAFGGVHAVPSPQDRTDFAQELDRIRGRFELAARLVADQSGLKERVEGTGRLNQASAELLSCVGPAARASGIERDARVDQPALAYPSLRVRAVTRDGGDVSARMHVKLEEVRVSFDLIGQLLHDWVDAFEPGGTPVGPQPGEGVGFVEASRGAVLAWVRLDAGRVVEAYQRDPSFLNWRGLQRAVLRNIVPDFPLINKSFNLSYSGSDA